MTTKKNTIHMVGHGHIDPTWLWRWTEGYEEVRATFRSALERMKETPAFKFTASSACFYAWLEECEPDMLEEIRQRVAEGRWELAGGWWVEPDCNIPAGESFVRHGLYSQRLFRRLFGKQATVGFNPDSFGHAGTLPQIYRKMGIDAYVYMRPEPPFEKQYPGGNTFRWKAMDGSEVLACALAWGYGAGDYDHVMRKFVELPKYASNNPNQTHFLGFFGVGNHGGGPTKASIRAILEAQQNPDMPNVEFSTLREYMDRFQESMRPEDIPVIDTDLQHHARGCYSAHSGIKRFNRLAECALMSAERFAAVATMREGIAFPSRKLEEAWRLVLYNQFHDILAGTSIQISYEDSRDQLGAARNTALEIQNRSMQRIARDIDTTPEGNTIVVFNPLPWPVKQNVKATDIVSRELKKPLHIVDDTGTVIPSQPVRGERITHTDYTFTAEVPGLGYRCYHARSGSNPAPLSRSLYGDRSFLENDWWRIEVDPYDGTICRLYDKQAGVETLKKGNILAAMVDQSDTWSHGYEEWRVEAGRFGNAKISLFEMGDVRATLLIQQTFNKSTVHQFLTLYRDTDVIDTMFRINWQEQFTLLKLAWETTIQGDTFFCDAPYGEQERRAEGFEEPCQKWFDLTGTIGEQPYGFAVLNDSKYSCDVRDGVMRLTLLRSPAYAYHDRGRFDSSEPWPIMDQGWQTVRVRLVPHAGDRHEAAVARRAWELNEPCFTHIESAHPGTLPPRASFLEVDTPNVIISVVKQEEDGQNLVVRGYETAGRETPATLNFGQNGVCCQVVFRPYEIKTVVVDMDSGKLRETNLLEE